MEFNLFNRRKDFINEQMPVRCGFKKLFDEVLIYECDTISFVRAVAHVLLGAIVGNGFTADYASVNADLSKV